MMVQIEKEFRLNKIQQKAYKNLLWFMDDRNLAQGRTTLAAKILLDLAFEQIGKEITLISHGQHIKPLQGAITSIYNEHVDAGKFAMELNEKTVKILEVV